MSVLAESLHAHWQAQMEKPFSRLLLHCIDRIFHGGERAANGDVDFGVGAILAILAAPGMFISIGLSSKYGTLFQFIRGDHSFDAYAASMPDEYFLIVLSMVVAGSVAIWKWDSLLPDRQDYGNLAHLPIPGRDLFLANLLALLLLAAILAIDINAASSVLFPLMTCWGTQSFGYVGLFFSTNLLAVVLAAAFGFLGVLSILGVLMALLPYRAFRKTSIYVRTALLILFAAFLTTSSSGPRHMRRLLLRGGVPWWKFPVPAWFTGLCQSLRGVEAPSFNSLAHGAAGATIAAFLIAVGAYALSYRRCFLRSAETILILPAGGGAIARHSFLAADSLLLRGPLQRGGYRFTMKTLFRSEAHSLTWIAFVSLGVILAAQTVFAATARGAHLPPIPSAALFGVPLALTYFLMLGLRLAFEIPAPLRANWLFRLGVDPGTKQCAALAKRVLATFEMPLLAGCFAVYARFWGWRIALGHTALVAVMAALLAETLLFNFRKIPFTCSAPPFKQTSIAALLLYVIGFLAFSTAIPALERQSFVFAFPYEQMIAILLAAWGISLYFIRKNQSESEHRLIFDDVLPPAVEVLDLSFRR